MRARSASPPLLPAGLRVATAMINGLPHANTMPVAGVVQRPVTEQLDLNFTTAALRHRVAFFPPSRAVRRR